MVRVHFSIVFTVVAIVVVVVDNVFVAFVVVVVLICHFAGRLTLVIQSMAERAASPSPSAFAFMFHTLYKPTRSPFPK